MMVFTKDKLPMEKSMALANTTSKMETSMRGKCTKA